jgi:hypothetical protein
MQAQYSEAFFNKEIAYLVLQIGKMNELILRCKNQKDNLGVSQYTRHRQQFMGQLNALLLPYNLQISAKV